ncbi:hypothetical protein [Aliiruegeria lutimaris]|uniref:Antibiotic biosynthesis monooxygenase n=1 Tax=Aliiruegeria lutimaris TaxID=571298 RepID=A0A1G8SIG6_9RHOB|nr:hypothetical protein [Aliiruegeria lutimaris]SDJ29026.1 hypothetical protein SAMN04488026_101521 [Aliiruegeria lutimaris]
MFARVTNYKMKPGSRAAATEIMNSLKADILALPGMTRFINVMNDDGNGYVIALSTEEAMDSDTANKVNQLWGAFSEHLEGPPDRASFHVIADWAA